MQKKQFQYWNVSIMLGERRARHVPFGAINGASAARELRDGWRLIIIKHRLCGHCLSINSSKSETQPAYWWATERRQADSLAPCSRWKELLIPSNLLSSQQFHHTIHHPICALLARRCSLVTLEAYGPAGCVISSININWFMSSRIGPKIRYRVSKFPIKQNSFCYYRSLFANDGIF